MAACSWGTLGEADSPGGVQTTSSMATQSFGKDRRLRSRAEYDPVFDQTQVRLSRRGIVMLARRNQLSRSRLGMVVPKKSLNLASDRSRLKRVIREAFRRDQTLHQGSGVDVVVLSRPGFRAKDSRALLLDLFGQLKQCFAALECG